MAGHQLFLSLGGNLGDKREIFTTTIRMIDNKIGHPVKISTVYESSPWGFCSTHFFRNQVLEIETLLTPYEVLAEIRTIEKFFGRRRKTGHYLSRKMDIDILFYDDLILNTDVLTLPHPMIALRRFVLEPLSEIAPDLFHPVIRDKVNHILAGCKDSSEVKKIDPIQEMGI
jgi:2-amino-4-hydroxy-6-hydroxymethyldihydropteridine diphosphokinase